MLQKRIVGVDAGATLQVDNENFHHTLEYAGRIRVDCRVAFAE